MSLGPMTLPSFRLRGQLGMRRELAESGQRPKVPCCDHSAPARLAAWCDRT